MSDDAERRGPWSYIQPWDIDSIPVDILDEDQRRGWMRAMFVAGGLPYMWRELAKPIADVVYALLELRPGDRVLLIGEAAEPVRSRARHIVADRLFGTAGEWLWPPEQATAAISARQRSGCRWDSAQAAPAYFRSQQPRR